MERRGAGSTTERLAAVNSRLLDYYVSGSKGNGGQMSPVRRFFCLFITFDLLFTSLLWLICLVLSGNQLILMIEKQILKYSIYSSIFDIVMLAASRFTLLLLAYGLCQISHWCIVAVTTLSSSALLVVKVFYYEWDKVDASSTFAVVLLLCSFVLAWVEVWLIDSRVIPREQRAVDIHNRLYPSETAPLLVDDDPLLSNVGEQSTFYSPVGTPPVEFNDEENVRNLEELKTYRRQADEAMSASYSSLNSAGWHLEQSLPNGDHIYTKKNSKEKKSYRFTGIICASSRVVFEELYLKVEESPSWNAALLDCKVIKRFDDYMDITYQVAADGGGGLVKSRDFVNLRLWEKKGDDYMTTGISVKYPTMPPAKEYVRGENGPCAWIIESLLPEENMCRLHWLLNTDLKGWLPQYLIDQTLAGVMLDFVAHLRRHLENLSTVNIIFSDGS